MVDRDPKIKRKFKDPVSEFDVKEVQNISRGWGGGGGERGE